MKTRLWLTIIILGTIIITVNIVLVEHTISTYTLNPNKTPPKQTCITETERKIVRGRSLSPLINPRDTVKILKDYYHCHDIERNHIIAYNYIGNENPIIKIVKGIPGDTFRLEQNKTGWNIIINNHTLRNSEDQPYIIGKKAYKMLYPYERDRGKIQNNAYLILGNKPSGTLDSTQFGLISNLEIIGKVVKE